MTTSRRDFLRCAVGAAIFARSPVLKDVVHDVIYPETTPSTLRAYPFILARAVEIDRIGFEVLEGREGEEGEVAIYSSVTELVLEPGKLVISGGRHDLSTGVKVSAVLKELRAGIYWWAFLGNLVFPEEKKSASKAMRSQITVHEYVGKMPSEFPARGRLRTIPASSCPNLCFRVSGGGDIYFGNGMG